ncbi:MAG TPA: pyrroline-5-carboxylate reductase [Solirubrobacteraceae bacterium]|nr:pyrroline-5-carboxylate reductase [Solirubrobacteraceae bacterium]
MAQTSPSEAAAYGVLGVGAIGAAIVTGLCEGVGDPPKVLLSPRSAGIAAGLAQRFATVEVAADNQAVVDGANVVIACVRPQVAQSVLAELRFPADRTVISAIAGVSVEALQPLVAPAADIARVIPLPSVARREGTTPVHPPNAAATALFDRLGATIEIADATTFEAFSASTATIAAHFAYLNAIAEWLARQGVPGPAATRYVASIFAGLAEPTLSGESFEQLAREHATPGGINEQLRNDLEQAGAFDSVSRGLQRVLDRLNAT